MANFWQTPVGPASCSWVPVGIEYIQLPLKNEKKPEALTCVKFTRYFAHPGEGWQTLIILSPSLYLGMPVIFLKIEKHFHGFRGKEV